MIAAASLMACSGSTGSQPPPAAGSGSHLTFAGNMTGEVTSIVATCGQQRLGTTGQNTHYLSVSGSLNGAAVLVEIYDPAGPASWEGSYHVFVRVTPRGSDYFTWFTGSVTGISGFSSTGGVELATTVPPRKNVDIQAGGQVPNSPISLTGRIVC
jgi:hypothetical protein